MPGVPRAGAGKAGQDRLVVSGRADGQGDLLRPPGVRAARHVSR